MQKNNSPALIEFHHVRKQFGLVLANDDLNFRVQKGTIHAIIGENGAGKSTAMKMLYGLYAPTSGEIRFRGELCHFRSPREAIACGIGMVHQHFMLAGPHTVLDNILLGAEGGGAFSPIRRTKARAELRALMSQYGLPVDLDRKIDSLSVGEEQRVEILKILYRHSEILILDEPTAVLTPQEIKDLFSNLRSMREEGKTILIITHKLKEVMALADFVTVFRAGRVAGERKITDTSAEDLAELMVGRKVSLHVKAERSAKPGAPVLQVDHLKVQEKKKQKARIEDLSLQVRAGEILGIAGVEGNGQSDLIKAILFAAEKKYRAQGDIQVAGTKINSLDCDEIRALGISLLAENRLKEGMLLQRPVVENFLLGHHKERHFQSAGILRWKKIRRQAHQAMEEYDIRPSSLTLAGGRLSGGNQQKLVVARELLHKPKLLIAAQPTRGVDIGAIEFIHKKIFSLRDSGAAVLLISSELDEILTLSDRILVLYDGAVAAEFTRANADESKIGFFMGGGKERSA